LIPLADDGIVVVPGVSAPGRTEGEMWEVNRALSEHTRYTQLENGRWKAQDRGFVTMAAEGDTPTESEQQLSRAMDVLLVSLIRGGKDREKPDVVARLSSFMLSDAISVVKSTARKTAVFKRKGLDTSSAEPEEPQKPERRPEARKPRKRR
jgi:hypothetical protein